MKRLPLTLLSLLLALSAQAEPTVKSVTFTATPAPVTDQQRSSYYTRSSAVVTYVNGKKKIFPLNYQALYRSADKIGDTYAGLVVDKDGKAIMHSAADKNGNVAQGPFYSYSPDGTSLLGMHKGQDSAYLVTHFEYSTEAPNVDASKPPVLRLHGYLPSVINQAKLIQDKKTGRLRVVELKNVDASASGGIWTPCQASQTPWGTHLGGEEYEPDAKEFETAAFEAMNLYGGTPGKDMQSGGSKPYGYGYKFEVSVSESGTTNFVKHYSMGRLANELGDVMPDRRTTYIGDDGRDTVMFMYVADKPGQLSSGTLYAAIWMQLHGDNAGQAGLKWVALGHASDEQIRELISSGIKFSDIFESATHEEVFKNPEHYRDFKAVYVYPGTGSETSHLEYLKLRQGKEQAAAFLESRRYAAMLGATSEFTKMEGVTHNARDKRLYIAISYIEDGMLAGKKSGPTDRPVDHISLDSDKKDLSCGAVYEAMLGGSQQDTTGNPIVSDWVAYEMHGMVTGARKPFWQNGSSLDKCDTDLVANPDNLKYSEAMRTLFIGEDSSNHLNNFVWAYNIDDRQSTRILSVPAGGENTGLQVVEDWNGHAYLMSNVQHPAASSDLKNYPAAIRDTLSAGIDKRGVIGYIGGMPGIKTGAR